MSEIEPKLGNIATVFKLNTEKRIDQDNLDDKTLEVISVLQEEMTNALRLLENAIISR